MRIKNSVNNIVYGLGSQLASTILAFIVRTVFIYSLSAEYLGVNGLFSNILSLLSLSNLGFNSAIIYSLYKPIIENNKEQIKAYMMIYKKVYRYVGIFILVVGLAIIPILPKLINGEVKISENINIIYFLFLLDSCVSYFYSYKQSILTASQKNYVISKIHTIIIIISNILQCMILILFKQYILVLLIQILSRLVENITLSQKVDKEYSYLNDKSYECTLSNESKKDLYKNVYSMFLYKISGTVINSTDNIIISYFIGIVYVGIYSNYVLIISTVKTFISYIFSSVVASVGNLVASDENDKKQFIFEEIFFLSFWIYGFCSITFYILLSNFISLWLGNKYILNEIITIIIIIDFYTAGMQNAATTYRDTTGMFNIGKYRPVIAAIFNLAISIILAPMLGIAGVILGTIVSRILTYFWFDPYVIYKNIFKKSSIEYFVNYLNKTLVVILTGIVTVLITRIINLEILIMKFIIDMLICIIIPNIIFYLVYRHDTRYKYIITIIKNIISNIRIKKRSIITE